MRGTLVIDESLLLPHESLDGRDDAALFHAPADALLRRLHYSNLRVAICYSERDTSTEVIYLIEVAKKYNFECISWSDRSLADSLNSFLPPPTDVKEAHVYATSKSDEGLFVKLVNRGWKVILKSFDDIYMEHTGFVIINNLEGFFFALHHLLKMEFHDMLPLSVGYVMKPSREQDFAKRGAFPFHPTPNGLMFVPLSFELPFSPQMQEFDIVLHKATDEIISIVPGACSQSPQGVTYSVGMQLLQRYFQDNPDCCIIDPLDNIGPLLDRLKIQELLMGLEENLNKDNGHKVRGPCFLKVDTYDDSNLEDELSKAKLTFPNIVKPQVACGVADAHSMALVFKIEHYRDLFVPLPAVIQEYVDHGSVLYKFYVLGERIFYAVKKSMPNADILKLSCETRGSGPILFDSLKSLPTAEINLQGSKKSLDNNLAEEAANWLKKRLGLTIFGFDVVVQEGSGDHVIVDVNYLPSFKEIPDHEAIPAFWDAIKSSYESKKAKGMVQ